MSINFFKGHPGARLYPKRELADAYAEVISRDYDYESDPLNRDPFTYGTDPGNYEVRKSIARWEDAHFHRATATDPDALNLTCGASYGVANVLTSVTSPEYTKRVFIITPTYFLINYAFVDVGLEGKLSGIKEVHDGPYDVDIDEFERQLKHYSEGLEPVGDSEINIVPDATDRGFRKYYRFVLYLVPTFSNPGAITYTLKTRQKLVELARQYDVLIISDDVYDHLNYGTDELVPKLVHVDRDSAPAGHKYGNTVSNASFSKLIAPGLRTGFQETINGNLALQLASTGANKSGGTPAQLNTFVVQSLIDSGKVDDIIARLNSTFLERAQALKAAIAEHLPPITKVYGGEGGYFIWVEIRAPGVDTQRINTLLAKQGVVIPSGENFEVNGEDQGWSKFGSRLCVAFLEKKEIEEGIKRWGAVLREQHPELYTN